MNRRNYGDSLENQLPNKSNYYPRTLRLQSWEVQLQNAQGEQSNLALMSEKLVSEKNDINFSEDTLKLIEDKLDWIEKNKKLICKTFIEDEGMFYGLNDEIEKQLSKKEKAKIDDLEFSAPLTEDEFSNSLYIAYINFYIENEDDISCNFDLDCEPDYLFGHLANIELDEDNKILMSGING